LFFAPWLIQFFFSPPIGPHEHQLQNGNVVFAKDNLKGASDPESSFHLFGAAIDVTLPLDPVLCQARILPSSLPEIRSSLCGLKIRTTISYLKFPIQTGSSGFPF
jgi:hypothetical protein